MKSSRVLKRNRLLLVLWVYVLPLCAVSPAQSKQVADVQARVALFQGDRVAAMTYSFDDGTSDQLTVAVPMLEKYGFRGTFFVIPFLVPETEEQVAAKKTGAWGTITWSQLKKMSQDGHEIGNHSGSHRGLKNLHDTILVKEIENARQIITEKIGVAPLTFCYPYNSFDEHVRSMALRNHIATRDSIKGLGLSSVDAAIKQHRWDVFMLHHIVVGDVDPQILENHFKYVKEREKEIWVSTFANVVRYVRERDDVKLKMVNKPNQITCTMETTLAPAIYDQPLTVVFNIKGAKKVKAMCSGKKMPVVIYPDKVCVDWVPGSKPVHINWK
ncbi:MAG: polysaccharide deacetylase family protein [Bacteroidales bacterium]|nr:polysaccharide deacetylase family protein [Bacteroidales bacterium]